MIAGAGVAFLVFWVPVLLSCVTDSLSKSDVESSSTMSCCFSSFCIGVGE